MNTSIRKKIILISLFFGIISFLFILFLIYPSLKQIKSLSEDISEIKKEAIALEVKKEGFDTIRKKYEEFISKEIEEINNILIDSEAPVEIIRFLEGAKERSGVSIIISPFSIKSSEDDLWNSMGFQINISGSSSNFFRFLEEIERSRYLIEIQSLSLRDTVFKEQEIETEGVSANLLIKVFTK